MSLPSGAWIGDYTGQVKPQRAVDSSKYLLEVFHDPTLGVRMDIDASAYGNELRFINDFRGIAPEPNVAFCLYRQPRTGELSVAVLTTVAIRYGAEILVDYGRSFWHDGNGTQDLREAAGEESTGCLDSPTPSTESVASAPIQSAAGMPSGSRKVASRAAGDRRLDGAASRSASAPTVAAVQSAREQPGGRLPLIRPASAPPAGRS